MEEGVVFRNKIQQINALLEEVLETIRRNLDKSALYDMEKQIGELERIKSADPLLNSRSLKDIESKIEYYKSKLIESKEYDVQASQLVRYLDDFMRESQQYLHPVDFAPKVSVLEQLHPFSGLHNLSKVHRILIIEYPRFSVEAKVNFFNRQYGLRGGKAVFVMENNSWGSKENPELSTVLDLILDGNHFWIVKMVAQYYDVFNQKQSGTDVLRWLIKYFNKRGRNLAYLKDYIQKNKK